MEGRKERERLSQLRQKLHQDINTYTQVLKSLENKGLITTGAEKEDIMTQINLFIDLSNACQAKLKYLARGTPSQRLAGFGHGNLGKL